MKLHIPCRDATRLMLRAFDVRLPWHERLAVRLHLMVCKACPAFQRQTQLMRAAVGAWRGYTEGREPTDSAGKAR